MSLASSYGIPEDEHARALSKISTKKNLNCSKANK